MTTIDIPKRTRRNGSLDPKNARTLHTPQAMNSAIKSICDILRRSGSAGALAYVPELSYLLFLRILDVREEEEAENAEAARVPFTPSLEYPYRWRDWASPHGAKRKELKEIENRDVRDWLNEELLPALHSLKDRPNATPRQKIISEALSGVRATQVDTDNNLLTVLDKIDEIHPNTMDKTQMFALSQVYEGLLLKMGEKGNDGGQFYTPREVIRAMVRVLNPRLGESVYDPCAGTGGFLAESCEYLKKELEATYLPEGYETLTRRTFYGREKEKVVYPITLSNLVLHGIDEPHIWHGNTLTQSGGYSGLFVNAPDQYDIILTNPPFGGKEGQDAQTEFAYKTGATQILFLQHIMSSLKTGGRCGMVIDEGSLFRTNETAFVQTKRKLLEEFDLWCIVSLPGGVFTSAGAGVKTNLLFFTKGQPTERIWYYDLSGLKIGKTTPLRDSQQNKCSSPRSLPSRLCGSDFSRQPKWNSLILESPLRARTSRNSSDCYRSAPTAKKAGQ